MASARKKAPSKRKAPAKKRAPAKKKAAARGGRRGKKRVVTVDFDGVESGGGVPTPDGYHIITLSQIDEEVGADSGEDYLSCRWKTHLKSNVYDNLSLQPQSLWKLRTLLEAAGYDVPDAEYDLDVDAMLDMEVGAEVLNEEYDNRDRPRIVSFMSVDQATAMGLVGADDDDDDDEEEDEPPPKKRRSKKKAAAEEEEDDDEDEDEDEDEDDEEEEEEDTPPKRKAKSKKKAPAKKKKSAALRPGARVTFEDADGEEVEGVIDYIDDDTNEATVVDDDDGEWEIPLEELTKA